MIELRLGRWQDALADIDEVDCLITDPPYSARTHRASDNISSRDQCVRQAIFYQALPIEDIVEVVELWAPRVHGWWAVFTDHDLSTPWMAELTRAGLHVFAPIPCVDPGSRVRLAGDGPSSWSVWLIVARPKSLCRWGTRPGAYVRQGPFERAVMIGGKPLWLMREVVRDYTKPGDIVCDPFAGMGTTLIAAAIEGRRAIGAEMDSETYEAAQARITRGHTPNMFTEVGQ